MDSENGYPVFKGLQKPLELMGIRGRFLMMAGVLAGGAFLALIILNICVSQVVGIIGGAVTLLAGYLVLKLKQKQGLHDKKRYNGVLVYHRLIK